MRPTSDDTFHVPPVAANAAIPPTNATGTVTRISDASTAEPSAMLRRTKTPKSATAMATPNARDDRAWLSTRPARSKK
jgi:hypothetical protein